MPDKGSCTLTEERLSNVKKITFAWTSDTGGDAGLATKTTAYTYNGAILAICTVPGTGGDQPSDNYDIVLNDANSVDVLNAQAANRSQTTTQWVTSSLGMVVGSALTLSVSNAGDTKKGTIYVFIGGPNVNLSTAYTDIVNALYGADGVATFPAAAAAGNGVSLAEVIRYIQSSQIGTLTNTGGTATLGGILGDVANSDLATRITNLANQAQKCVAAKEAHANGTLWTIAGGPIKVNAIVGYVTVQIDAVAATLKIQTTPTGGAATDLSAASASLSGAAVNTVLGVDGVKATGLVVAADAGIGLKAASGNMPLYLVPGVVSLVNTGVAITNGRISWVLLYEPLAPGVTVS